MYLTKSQEAAAEWYIATMNAMLGPGVDIRGRSRRHDIAWGRYIVADALIARQRFTFGDAARILGRDHSTSVWWRKCIADMKAMPVIYAYENELYIDFNSRI